jgi:hypothetical protein
MLVTMGDQSIEAVVDTGSANLLVIGDSAHCENCKNDYGYDSVYTPGPTSQEGTDKWYMNFAPIGQASVQAYEDNVALEKYTLNSYSFGLVIAEKGIPNILGLAYKGVARPSPNPQTPFFDALVTKYKFKNQFSMNLCRNKKGSNLTLGGYEAGLASKMSSVLWTPISQKIWYSVKVSKMYTSETALDLVPGSQWVWDLSSSDTIIVDSGTNPLVISSEQIPSLVSVLKDFAELNNISIPENFWPTAQVKGSSTNLTDEEIAKFPVIYLDFLSLESSTKSFALSITPQNYFQTQADGKKFLGIEPGNGFYILGTVLMENYVVLHDRGSLDPNDTNSKIGFYPNTEFCL